MGKRLLSVLLLILFSFTIIEIGLTLPLYGQAPTPLETTNTEKNPSQNIKKETKPPQDSAKNFTVSPQIYSPTTPLTKKTTNKHDDKTTTDWWLVGFTGALVGVGILQFIALRQQANWMREQSKEIGQSIAIMRQELVLTQRPRLRVRNVVIRNLFDIDTPLRGQLYVINVGGTPATITGIGCWIECLQGGLPMERPYEGENPNYQVFIKLEPGRHFPLPFQNDSPFMREACDSIRRGLKEYTLYVMGYVEYVDDISIPRRTEFCREFGWPKNEIGELRRQRRFFAVDDPDYESED